MTSHTTSETADRIFYICTQCFDDAPDASGHIDRNELRVAADGRWLCESCFDEEWKPGAPVSWSALPIPPGYNAAPQKPAPDAMREALTDIGRQKTIPELIEDGNEVGDLEYAYNMIIARARQALSAPVPPPDGAAISSIPASDDAATLAGSTERASTCGHAPCVGIEASSPGAAEPSPFVQALNEIVSDANAGVIRDTGAAQPDDVRSALAERVGKDITCTRTYTMKEWSIIEDALRSAPVSAAPHPFIEVPLTFLYKNHRGEVALRNVFPISVRFGTTEWHPEAQWLLRAFDRDKQAEREFAMRDINPPAAAPVRDREKMIHIVSHLLAGNSFALITGGHHEEFASKIVDRIGQSSAAVGVTREDLVKAFRERFSYLDRYCEPDRVVEWFVSRLSPAPDATVSELARVRGNHKDAVETKRRTDARLKVALAGLQQIYTVCQDNAGENCDQRMTVDFVREVAGDAFEKATAESSPQDVGKEAKSLLDPVVDSRNDQEGAVSARDAVIEECAKVIDAECERILSKQKLTTAGDLVIQNQINSNLRMMAVFLPELSSAIRSLAQGAKP